MGIVILHIIKMILIVLGTHTITQNWIIAVLAGVLVEGGISKFFWYLSGIWYVLFEYFYIGEISIYGWGVLGISIIIVLISILSSKLGYRWSLYILKDENLMYALHCNSVIKILGYIMGYFKRYGNPLSPWSLVLSFNKTHQYIPLSVKYFIYDGNNISPELIEKISAIDPNFMDKKGRAPYFIDVQTNRELNIQSKDKPLQQQIDDIRAGVPKEVTFFSIMDNIFVTDGGI